MGRATEFRGVYADAFHPGFKSHEEVTRMVSAAKEANLNALFVQVRKRGDAYYNSHLEPKASDIAPGYDPLADVIRQAHAAGIQVHAWISTYEVSHESYSLGDTHVCRTHPEWLMALEDGSTVQSHGRVYLDPCIPGVQDQFVSVVADIAEHYDVDGIHLEGVRYIRREAMYNKIALELYQKQSGRSDVPKYDDADWCKWRREQVTALVRKVREKLAVVKPKAVLTAAVMTPTPAMASEYCFQDWDGWMREGLLDAVVPMLYTNSAGIVPAVADLLSVRNGRHMYIALGTYQITGDVASRQIEETRAAGADGVVLFSYHYLALESGGARAQMADMASSVFAERAGRPVMSWRAAKGAKE